MGVSFGLVAEAAWKCARALAVASLRSPPTFQKSFKSGDFGGAEVIAGILA